jgi:hypothetical protein
MVEGNQTTLVLLNYMRPQNVQHILRSVDSISCISEVMVLHQLPQTLIQYTSTVKTVRHFKAFNKENYGCANRYFYAPLAQNQFVLFFDDDVLPSQNIIDDMIRSLRSGHKHVGPFGRTCDELGYVPGIGRGRRLDALAGKMTMTHRWLTEDFNANMEFYMEDLLNSHGRVDDVLFSIHNRRVTRTLPKEVKGRVMRLPTGNVGMEKSLRHPRQRDIVCKIHSPGFSLMRGCINQKSSLCSAQSQLNCTKEIKKGQSICGF